MKRTISPIVEVAPPDSARVAEWVHALALRYGGLMEVSVIGNSLLGRKIHSFHIGSRRRHVLYCGGVHGREWITTLLLLHFAEELLAACADGTALCEMDVRRLLETGGLTVIPVLNPDGAEISLHAGKGGVPEDYLVPALASSPLGEKLRNDREFCRRWKANARGVDINRNFDAGWDDMRLISLENGIRGPASEGWTGECPVSEPETRAVVSLCEKERFRHLIAFHSQGEVIYWNYRQCTPPKTHIMARILSMSSGYALGEPALSACAAGLKDWFMEHYRAPAFTVEVGSGRCPLPLSSFRFLYNRLREMLVLGIAM